MINQIADYAIPIILLLIPLVAWLKGVAVFEEFVNGAAEGLGLTLKIFPFLLSMMLAIAVFRASGAFEAIANLLSPLCQKIGLPTEVLPIALLRPFSGSGALALTADVLHTKGADSFSGRLASVIQGSTDTTFYLLAVYFGSVGVIKYRYAPLVGLATDIISFISAFIACTIIFGG